MSNVYCNDCKHTKKSNGNIFCMNPNNLGNWYAKDGCKTHPKEINKDNNCLWFEFEVKPARSKDSYNY